MIYISSLTSGIHRYELRDGNLIHADLFAPMDRCQYFILAGDFVYAVHESDSGSIVKALSLTTGEVLNQHPSGGKDACYLHLHNKTLYVVNYAGVEGGAGNIAVFPVLDDGRLGEMRAMIHFEGSSVHPDRQNEAHPHMLKTHGDSALVSDLGSDKLRFYDLETLTPREVISTPAGSGPRHFLIDGSRLYVVNELNNTLSLYDDGVEIQTISTLPEGEHGECTAADIHRAGQFLYVSNRGNPTIAIFKIVSEDGRFASVGHEETRGEWTRSFCISDGYLIAANQLGDNVTVFKIDTETGALKWTEQTVVLARPICVQTE